MRNRKRRRLAQEREAAATQEAPKEVAPTPAPVVEELTAPVEEEEPKKIRKRKSLFSKD
tara:strand:- start:57 stop:233 length:177 start_codon:yes stop_codon:yes gene_type:complete